METDETETDWKKLGDVSADLLEGLADKRRTAFREKRAALLERVEDDAPQSPAPRRRGTVAPKNVPAPRVEGAVREGIEGCETITTPMPGYVILIGPGWGAADDAEGGDGVANVAGSSAPHRENGAGQK